MSPRNIARLVAAATLIGALVTVTTGCAGLPGATGPAPTSSATATPGPETTTAPPSPEPVPSAPTDSPDPAPEPAPDPLPTTGAGYGAFSRDELAQICVDATASTFSSDVRFDVENTRIEQRTVTPEWLVIVPAQTGGVDGHSLCTIGGAPSAPVLELSSGSLSDLPEEQIQRLIRGENEGGDR